MNRIINDDIVSIFSDFTVLKEYLKIASEMYFMNVANIVAIHAQYPIATKVASSKIWQKKAVSVPFGQQGIYISLTDTNVSENTVKLIERYVTVFDIAQTDSVPDNVKRDINYCLETVKNLHPTAEVSLPANNSGYITEDGIICIKDTNTLEEKLTNWIKMYFQYVIYSSVGQDAEYKNFLVLCCTYSVLSYFGFKDVHIYNPFSSGSIEMLCDIQRFIYGFWEKFYLHESSASVCLNFFECNVVNRNILSFEKKDLIERLSILRSSSVEYADSIDNLEYKLSVMTDAAFKVLAADVRDAKVISTDGYLCEEYILI